MGELTRIRYVLWSQRTDDCCHYCTRLMTPPQRMFETKHGLMATVDHMIPRCRGGSVAGNNVVLACRDCNELKGELTSEEFEAAVLWMVETGRSAETRGSNHYRPLHTHLDVLDFLRSQGFLTDVGAKPRPSGRAWVPSPPCNLDRAGEALARFREKERQRAELRAALNSPSPA